MVRTSDSSARLPKEKTDKKEWHKNESRLPVGSYSDSRSARYNRRRPTSCTHIPVHKHLPYNEWVPGVCVSTTDLSVVRCLRSLVPCSQVLSALLTPSRL